MRSDSGDFGGGAGIGVQQLGGGEALHGWILADGDGTGVIGPLQDIFTGSGVRLAVQC
jgi:hypothetical protein